MLSDDFRTVVEQYGLSVLEWRVLATLASNNAMTVSALADVTVSKQPTVTRLLIRLEAQGYIARSASLDDRRCTLIKVTRTGKRLVSGLIELAEQHERDILKSHSPEKLKC